VPALDAMQLRAIPLITAFTVDGQRALLQLPPRKRGDGVVCANNAEDFVPPAAARRVGCDGGWHREVEPAERDRGPGSGG